MPQKEIVQPSGMPAPTAPFSLATKLGQLVFVAGLAVFNPQTGRAEGDIREQTRSTLERIQGVLAGAGTTLDNVLSATCYLANKDDFSAFNEEYTKYFPTNRPARATVMVALGPPNQLVQIQVTACVPD